MNSIQKNKVVQWTIAIIVGLGGLAVIGMAGQWWISQEVKSQLANISVPEEVVTLASDVQSIKTDIENIDDNVDRALESQQRFEEIFMEYLQNEANR